MLERKVTVLVRISGHWSDDEKTKLIEAGVDVESLWKYPGKLVALGEPFPGSTFQSILGHFQFTTEVKNYPNRWDD